MTTFHTEFEAFIREHDKRIADAWFQRGVSRGEFEARAKCREEIEEWKTKAQGADNEVDQLNAEIARLKALQADSLQGARGEIRRQVATECAEIAASHRDCCGQWHEHSKTYLCNKAIEQEIHARYGLNK